MEILAILVLLFWISRIPHYLAASLRDLPQNLAIQVPQNISLIVAARDEVDAIEASVQSLLSQDWPHLELIVVDDRSTDGTSERLDQLAQISPALQVIHNDQLPPGWLGKCWALHLGSQKAQGDWLIFCDGDVLMQKHCVRSALATCQTENYQHLCLAPRMISQHYWQDAVVSSLSFLFYLFQNPRHVFASEKPGAYMGIGAFNMIKRENYQSIGGHETLRLEVVDDVFLGMLVKRKGARSAFFLGHRLASIHWYAGLWAYIRGLEKNSFAGLRFSWALLFSAIVFQSLIFFVPLLSLFATQGWVFWIWLSIVLLSHGLFLRTCQRQGTQGNRALALYPAIAIQFVTFIRSAWIMTRQKGVLWRGSFYPLDELKKAQRILRGPLWGQGWRSRKI